MHSIIMLLFITSYGPAGAVTKASLHERATAVQESLLEILTPEFPSVALSVDGNSVIIDATDDAELRELARRFAIEPRFNGVEVFVRADRSPASVLARLRHELTRLDEPGRSTMVAPSAGQGIFLYARDEAHRRRNLERFGRSYWNATLRHDILIESGEAVTADSVRERLGSHLRLDAEQVASRFDERGQDVWIGAATAQRQTELAEIYAEGSIQGIPITIERIAPAGPTGRLALIDRCQYHLGRFTKVFGWLGARARE